MEENGGFAWGEAHSAVDAVLFVLQDAYSWLSRLLPHSSLWAIVPVASSVEVLPTESVPLMGQSSS